MIFVAEIMNTLPTCRSLSPSVSLGGEGDRLRLKNGRVGKGFVPVPPLDRRPWPDSPPPLFSLPDLITGDVRAIPVIIAIRGLKSDCSVFAIMYYEQ